MAISFRAGVMSEPGKDSSGPHSAGAVRRKDNHSRHHHRNHQQHQDGAAQSTLNSHYLSRESSTLGEMSGESPPQQHALFVTNLEHNKIVLDKVVLNNVRVLRRCVNWRCYVPCMRYLQARWHVGSALVCAGI